jgi:hypothetical protein
VLAGRNRELLPAGASAPALRKEEAIPFCIGGGSEMANMSSEKILMAAAMLPRINECLAELGYEIRDFSLYMPRPYEGRKHGAGIRLALEPRELYPDKPVTKGI